MSDVFNTINDTMGVVIGWVDAPLITRMRMRDIPDSIGNEVTHAWVIMLHVHLHSQTTFTLIIETHPHIVEFG